MKENNEELKTLQNVVSLIGQAKVGVTLTQVQTRGEETIGSLVVAQRTLKEGIPSIHFGGNYIFLALDFKNAKGMDSKAVSHTLKQWLNKSTESEVTNKEVEDHFYFVLDLVSVAEDGLTYGLKLVNPAFWGMDESTLNMSFDKASASFYRQAVDYSNIERKEKIEAMNEMAYKNGLE